MCHENDKKLNKNKGLKFLSIALNMAGEMLSDKEKKKKTNQFESCEKSY